MGRFSKLETGNAARPEEAKAAAGPPTKQDEPLAGPQYDYGYYVGEAERFFFHGEWQKALRLFSRAIQADRTHVYPWIGQVLCLLELKQSKEAMAWVRRCLELFPEDARVLSLQGTVYAHEGMAERGLGCSDHALGQSASDPLVWILRGEILCLADNKNAAFCFEKAMEGRSYGDWRVPAQIGLFLLRMRSWSLASTYLKAAVEAEPKNDYLWMRLANAYERLGLAHPACEAYSAAHQLNPENQEAAKSLNRLANTPLFVRFFKRVFG